MRTTHFARALGELITASGLTRYRVAARAGISQGHMTKLARGDRLPTETVLHKLAPVLGTTYEALHKVALRDRTTAEERQAIAEIVAEEASLEQMARWVSVHFRAKEGPPEAQEEFLHQLVTQIRIVETNWVRRGPEEGPRP